MKLCIAEHEKETEALKAETMRKAESYLFRTYVTDALNIIEKNTAVHGGSAHNKRYSDIVDMIRNPEKYSEEKAQETISRFLDVFGEEGEDN